MSLRLRLFLLLFTANAVIFAAISGVAWRQQRIQAEAGAKASQRLFESQFRDRIPLAFASFADEGELEAQAIELLRLGSELDSLFADLQLALFSGGVPFVVVNPGGALDRDVATDERVQQGLSQLVRTRQPVEAGGGTWVPIELDGELAGGVWSVSEAGEAAALSFWQFVWPVLAGTVAFGIVVDLLLRSGIVRPLHALGRNAQAIGEGEHDLHMPSVTAPELRVFVAAFEAMAERVRGHQRELEEEIARTVEEVKRRERALQQSGRLASMGTLAAGIAHEINNPIGGMQNALRLIEKREDLDDRERRYLLLIRDGLERVAGTARRVLDFSPKGERALPFEVSAAVEGSRALVEHRLHQQTVEVLVDLPEDLPQLFGDRHEFEQVLLNFWINALDVLEGRDDARIEIRARQDGDEVELVFSDNGPGLARESLPRVTDPFFTAKGRPDASGLGLFISSTIVRDLGGSMEFDSDVGAGFRVTIRLPAGGDDSGAP